jgi:hypothetical protein
MMNIPIVADWAVVRQNRATSAIGCGSLTASENPASRIPRIAGFSTRRGLALVTPASMRKITGEVPFGCRPPFHRAFCRKKHLFKPSLKRHSAGCAVKALQPWHIVAGN